MLDEWRRLVAILTVIFAVTSGARRYYPNCYFPRNCQLPDCYCKYEDIPEEIDRIKTPQMILFTYTGAVTSKVRSDITEMFPDTLRNPNNCPVGITLFVSTRGTDKCTLHKLYVRGHEVALSASIGSFANATNPIIAQKQDIAGKANIDPADIVGMRAHNLRPQGDAQFRMLSEGEFLYDSSIFAGPSEETNYESPYLWPFTLNRTLEQLEIKCHVPTCPSQSYPSMWEMPVSRLIATRMNKPRLCTYLDDCISDYTTPNDVAALLLRHIKYLDDDVNGNRAPLQVNLRARTLQTKIAVEGVKKFLDDVMKRQDTWLLTSREALSWMQYPTEQSVILEQGFWECARIPYIKCKEGNNTRLSVSATFSLVIDVEKLWIWQGVIYILIFFVTLRYDRVMMSRKNKKFK